MPVFVALTVAVAHAQRSPLEIIEQAYAPYMSADDPLAADLKIRALAEDPYKFWRGSKDLFFIWCKTNTADWLADAAAYVPSHGDLHMGNIGAYAQQRSWGRLAFGMVDFDDAALLPFQIELLQGAITLRLVARQNDIVMDDAAQQRTLNTMLQAYRAASGARRNATILLLDAGDKNAAALLSRGGISYRDELDRYTADGKFRPEIRSGKGALREILRPAMDRADELAAGLAQAIANDAAAVRLFRFEDAEQIREAMIDVAQRTRLGSSGSQGLKKYLVLMRQPLRGIRHDVIVYLKQEIPPAAERSGAIPPQAILPGQRVKQHMDQLTEPRPLLNSWCDMGGESYWVSIKEPWSDELNPADVKTAKDLLRVAAIWGTVAGAAHRKDGRFAVILPRLTPTLLTQLRQRSDAFVKKLDEDFAAFCADPRVQQAIDRADQFTRNYAAR